MTQIKDSGERETFDTGAVRDAADGKPRLELISPIFERRLGGWLTMGAEKYTPRNWEKGIPMERSMASLLRHANQYREGDRSEDHLAAIACNIMFLIHTEEMVARGMLPATLADMPTYVAAAKAAEPGIPAPAAEAALPYEPKIGDVVWVDSDPVPMGELMLPVSIRGVGKITEAPRASQSGCEIRVAPLSEWAGCIDDFKANRWYVRRRDIRLATAAEIADAKEPKA